MGRNGGMKRWLGRSVTVILLLCCALAAICWMTSYRREDRAFMSRDGRCIQVVSHRGLLSVFTLAEYPTPLPWTWEHDDGAIKAPPGRSPQLRGIGGTLEMVLIPRNQDSWGPLTMSNGRAYTDPYAPNVLARRLKSVPQYVSKPAHPGAPGRPAPPPKTSDQTIDQLINAARAPQESRTLRLSPSTPQGPKSTAAGEPLDLGSNDAFSLGIVPSSKRESPATARGGALTMTGASVPSGSSTRLRISFDQSWSYVYSGMEVPYYALFLIPFSPLLVIGALKFRRHRLRQIRQREGRCLACGYDLHGGSTEQCPECGAQLRGDGSPTRTLTPA
jgi:hypothetical protein